jgi:hypothetical protein
MQKIAARRQRPDAIDTDPRNTGSRSHLTDQELVTILLEALEKLSHEVAGILGIVGVAGDELQYTIGITKLTVLGDRMKLAKVAISKARDLWSGPDMHYTPNELECNACGRKTQSDSFGSLCGVNECRGTLRNPRHWRD